MKNKKRVLLLVLVILLIVIACTLGLLAFPTEFLMNFSVTILSIIPTVISYFIFANLNKGENSSVENPDYYDAIRKTLDTENKG